MTFIVSLRKFLDRAGSTMLVWFEPHERMDEAVRCWNERWPISGSHAHIKLAVAVARHNVDYGIAAICY
jgi:hypothetical protein